MPALDGVGELFARGLAELDVDMSDIPFLAHIDGQTVGELESELRFVLNSEGVGQIRGIVGVVIIVAVVAEQIVDACPFSVE